jgi:hypothetical protein
MTKYTYILSNTYIHSGLEVKMRPTGRKGQGNALVQAVVAPHRPTAEPVRIVQAEVFGPEEEEGGAERTTNDRDSGIFSDTTSERVSVHRVRPADGGRWKLAAVKKVPFGVGYVLWLGVSHIICECIVCRQGRLILNGGHFFRV